MMKHHFIKILYGKIKGKEWVRRRGETIICKCTYIPMKNQTFINYVCHLLMIAISRASVNEELGRTLKLLEKINISCVPSCISSSVKHQSFITLSICHLLFTKNPNNGKLVTTLTQLCLFFKTIMSTINSTIYIMQSRVWKLRVITTRPELKSIYFHKVSFCEDTESSVKHECWE